MDDEVKRLGDGGEKDPESPFVERQAVAGRHGDERRSAKSNRHPKGATFSEPVAEKNDGQEYREHWSRIDEQARGAGAHGLLARVECDVVHDDPSQAERQEPEPVPGSGLQ